MEIHAENDHPYVTERTKLDHVGDKETPAHTQESSKPFKKPTSAVPWYNPKGWSLWTRLFLAAAILAVVAVAVVIGTIEGIKAARYPNYTPLNYQLVDTYEGTSFFDRFVYFSDLDPTEGFVK